jgi:hypothetical protein
MASDECHCLVRCATTEEQVLRARKRLARLTHMGDGHGELIVALSLVGRHSYDASASVALLRENYPGLITALGVKSE